MTEWLNSWKDFERICAVSGITVKEMELRGKRFLTYYKELCCTPEYILPPEPAGNVIEKKEQFLSRIEELFDNSTKPLYGRKTADLKLQPFTYKEAKAFFPKYNNGEILTAYSILCGMPLYLSLFFYLFVDFFVVILHLFVLLYLMEYPYQD